MIGSSSRLLSLSGLDVPDEQPTANARVTRKNDFRSRRNGILHFAPLGVRVLALPRRGEEALQPLGVSVGADRLLVGDHDEPRLRSARFGHVLTRGIAYIGARISTYLRIVHRERSGVEERLEREGLVFLVPHDHVRAREAADVEEQVVPPGHADRELVVLRVRAADEDLEAVARREAARPARLFLLLLLRLGRLPLARRVAELLELLLDPVEVPFGRRLQLGAESRERLRLGVRLAEARLDRHDPPVELLGALEQRPGLIHDRDERVDLELDLLRLGCEVVEDRDPRLALLDLLGVGLEELALLPQLLRLLSLFPLLLELLDEPADALLALDRRPEERRVTVLGLLLGVDPAGLLGDPPRERERRRVGLDLGGEDGLVARRRTRRRWSPLRAWVERPLGPPGPEREHDLALLPEEDEVRGAPGELDDEPVAREVEEDDPVALDEGDRLELGAAELLPQRREEEVGVVLPLLLLLRVVGAHDLRREGAQARRLGAEPHLEGEPSLGFASKEEDPRVLVRAPDAVRLEAHARGPRFPDDADEVGAREHSGDELNSPPSRSRHPSHSAAWRSSSEVRHERSSSFLKKS